MNGYMFLFLVLIIFFMLSCSENINTDTSFKRVPAAGSLPVSFGEIIYGKNSLYHEQPPGSFRQDLSGAATDGSIIIFTDDGGSPSEYNFIRVMRELPDTKAVNLPLSANHIDLEGATFYKNSFVITTSLSQADNADARRLSCFTIKKHPAPRLVKEKSVDLRDQLMAALNIHFGEEWFNRIKDQPGKSGGLNIEGLSSSHNGGDVLLWGLRSPLYGEVFPDDLKKGSAIIARVHKPFKKNPTITFITVKLATENGDHGIRGIEWIPGLYGYVIIGGPVPKDSGYSLWRLSPYGQLDRIDLPGFDQLCRPESVIQVREGCTDYLVVLSEESGAECENAEFTFIKAEITVYIPPKQK
jgi:hypothetical protein